jgi:hypothetical protein
MSPRCRHLYAASSSACAAAGAGGGWSTGRAVGRSTGGAVATSGCCERQRRVEHREGPAGGAQEGSRARRWAGTARRHWRAAAPRELDPEVAAMEAPRRRPSTTGEQRLEHHVSGSPRPLVTGSGDARPQRRHAGRQWSRILPGGERESGVGYFLEKKRMKHIRVDEIG